jgi:hypothetical protein
MQTRKKEVKLENLNFKNDIFDKNKNQRDYDKEPLILRNYTSWALFIHFLLIFAFWVIVSAFVLNKFDEFEDRNLEIGIAIQTAISFGFITTLILILDFKNILSIKPHYTHFYNSKVVFYNHNNKIDETIHFQVMGDRIVLHNPFYNPIGYDISHVKKEEGKMVFCSFMRIITTTGFGWAFLSAFTIINFVSRYSFGPFLLSVLITIFTLFLAEFLEILVFMGIYKKSNKTLKNFWKYARKFQINIEWASIERWKITPTINMFYFNQKDHDELRQYILTIFNRDIDNNLK